MKLNEDVVKSLSVPTAGNKVHYFAGAVLQGAKVPRGFGVRVTAGGVRSFVMNYRIGAFERRFTIGQYPDWSVLRAVKQARELRQRIDRGEDPLDERRKQDAAAATTFKAIADDYLTREEKRLRSIDQRRAVFERLVYPAFGSRQIGDIKRSDIVKLLDKIEDERGARMAHVTLAYIGKVMNWHAARDDDFRTPIVRGMGRVKSKERARERTLADGELQAVWHAAEGFPGVFGAMVRFILLTGARRTEASAMAWGELAGAEWTLPAARNKTKVDLVRPLSPEARAVLPKKVDGCDFVFTTDGATPLSGFSKFKLALDVAILADLQKVHRSAKPLLNWTLHDLRRTARSLMSRAGVPADHAERCLGHVLPGVRGVYDRYEYLVEKREAFDRLAALIMQIVKPS